MHLREQCAQMHVYVCVCGGGGGEGGKRGIMCLAMIYGHDLW